MALSFFLVVLLLAVSSKGASQTQTGLQDTAYDPFSEEPSWYGSVFATPPHPASFADLASIQSTTQNYQLGFLQHPNIRNGTLIFCTEGDLYVTYLPVFLQMSLQQGQQQEQKQQDKESEVDNEEEDDDDNARNRTKARNIRITAATTTTEQVSTSNSTQTLDEEDSTKEQEQDVEEEPEEEKPTFPAMKLTTVGNVLSPFISPRRSCSIHSHLHWITGSLYHGFECTPSSTSGTNLLH